MSEEINERSEEEYVQELREAIRTTVEQITTKVNKSALTYMLNQKQWIDPKNTSEAEKFFVEKISKVLTDEITSSLYNSLNL